MVGAALRLPGSEGYSRNATSVSCLMSNFENDGIHDKLQRLDLSNFLPETTYLDLPIAMPQVGDRTVSVAHANEITSGIHGVSWTE